MYGAPAQSPTRFDGHRPTTIDDVYHAFGKPTFDHQSDIEIFDNTDPEEADEIIAAVYEAFGKPNFDSHDSSRKEETLGQPTTFLDDDHQDDEDVAEIKGLVYEAFGKPDSDIEEEGKFWVSDPPVALSNPFFRQKWTY